MEPKILETTEYTITQTGEVALLIQSDFDIMGFYKEIQESDRNADFDNIIRLEYKNKQKTIVFLSSVEICTKKIESNTNKQQIHKPIFDKEKTQNKISNNIKFYNVVFEKSVLLYQRSINANISFESCHFKQGIDFANSEFLGDVDLSSSVLEGEQNTCHNSIFYGNVVMDNVVFKHKDTAEAKKDERLFFDNAHFAKSLSIQNAEIHSETHFNKIKLEPQGSLDFSHTKFYQTPIFNFTYDTKFYKATFMKQADFSKTHFQASVNFSGSTFKEYANFSQCSFAKSVDFSECKFVVSPKNNIVSQGQKINFSQAIFQDSVYFTNVTFNEAVDFNQCIFEKDVSFYGAKFEKAPNFLQAQFKGSLNLVNANLDFDFEALKELIISEFHKYNHIVPQSFFQKIKQCISATIKREHTNDKNPTITKPLTYFANDFRDSFRGFKNALIKDNNLLDASNFHRVELYCKEIELDSKKPQTFSKEWIDVIVLQFYRLTSDHHTDLIKIIGWIIALIGSLGIFLFLIKHYNVWDFCCFAAIVIYSILVWILMLCFRIIAVVPFLILIYYNPKYIFGIANIFGNTHSGFENILLSIYSILLFLLVFSLQKTARKNSIIPH